MDEDFSAEMPGSKAKTELESVLGRGLLGHIAASVLWVRYALLSLLEVSGAGSAPDPCFQAILAPARRSPAPVVSAPVPRRVAGQTGVDLTKFARTDTGRIRHLTNAEWVYVKSHDIEAVAHGFTDAEMEVLLAYMEDAVAQQQGKGLARR